MVTEPELSEMDNVYKKSILHTMYIYSQIFAQDIQCTYTLRFSKNMQNTKNSCLKKYTQYTFRTYFKKIVSNNSKY